jgi:sec-independent protein translocase protein TatB
MFDIGFSELLLIGVVALVVIGPERLPGVARTLGRWVGGIRRFMNDVKRDIDKELKEAQELTDLIEEQKELQETHQILEKTVSDLNTPTPVPSAKPAAAAPAPAAIAASTPASLEAKPQDTQTPTVVKAADAPAGGKPAADDRQTHG